MCNVSTDALLVAMLEDPLVMLEDLKPLFSNKLAGAAHYETYHAGIVPLSLAERVPIPSCATHQY